MALLSRARDNQEVLKDVRVSKKNRDKIKMIEEYKKYFYKFFEKKETGLYEKTTILKESAVAHLVISSPYNEVVAQKECFPILGCFPYIGFFKKKSALEYAEQKKKEGFIVWNRPVYAYSMLGYFDDVILSSFFAYEDYELAEMIFHELFHSIYFIKDEVELNENLANYFGQELAMNYFNFSDKDRKKKAVDYSNQRLLNRLVVKMVGELNQRYKERENITREEASKILNDFLQNSFYPTIKNKCQELSITTDRCYYQKRVWNNASFAAFLTYEKEANKVGKLRVKLGLGLKEFYHYLEEQYQQYDDGDYEMTFSEFLFTPLK